MNGLSNHGLQAAVGGGLAPARRPGSPTAPEAERQTAHLKGVENLEVPDPVILVPPDTSWPALFEVERDRLSQVLVGIRHNIEHIGSTAVPGLVAKPIIDLMVGVEALALLRPDIADLEVLGYRYRPEMESEIPERRFFVRVQRATRTHHLHVVQAGSAFWVEHLLFRDYLRSRPEAREAYNRIKLSLVQQYRDDRDAYTQEKAAFIHQVLATARDQPAV